MSTDIDGNAVYHVRGKDKQIRAITVPREIAMLIPEGTLFRFRLTDEGFEYIRVKEITEGLPAWLTGEDQP